MQNGRRQHRGDAGLLTHNKVLHVRRTEARICFEGGGKILKKGTSQKAGGRDGILASETIGLTDRRGRIGNSLSYRVAAAQRNYGENESLGKRGKRSHGQVGGNLGLSDLCKGRCKELDPGPSQKGFPKLDRGPKSRSQGSARRIRQKGLKDESLCEVQSCTALPPVYGRDEEENRDEKRVFR